MRLHVTHYDIGAPVLAAMPFVEHSIRLARPGSRGQVDPQSSALVWVPSGLRGDLTSRCTRRGRGRDLYVTVTQAIAPQQFLRIRSPLLAALWFVMRLFRLLGHDTPHVFCCSVCAGSSFFPSSHLSCLWYK